MKNATRERAGTQCSGHFWFARRASTTLRSAVAAQALALALFGTRAAAEQHPTDSCPPSGEENHYTEQGQYELGGSARGNWSPDAFTLALGAGLGIFVVDRLELSLLGELAYLNQRAATGGRVSALTFAAVLEPSYHLPVSKTVALFGGLGAGIAYQEKHALFDLQPRAGVNLLVGTSSVISPEISVPILIGTRRDPGEATVTASLALGVGLATTF